MDILRKTSTQEFLSLYLKDRVTIINLNLKNRNFFIRDMSIEYMRKLNNLCFISVVLVAVFYRLLLSILLLPIKILLTQFFFIVFLGYYIKLYLSTNNKELSIPNLQEFTESNFVLRHVFRDITFEPPLNDRRQGCQG